MTPLKSWSKARLRGTRIAADTPASPMKLLPVPPVAQRTDFSCGAAVLLSALRYWLGDTSAPPDETALWGALGTNPVDGTSPEPIAAAARSFGLNASVQGGIRASDLTSLVDSGAVAILAVQAWEDDPGERLGDPTAGHWVVLSGVGNGSARVMDPAIGGFRDVALPDLEKRLRGLDTDNVPPGLAVIVRR